jgi:glycosyltransferase involved in cell wall biosynthesis
MALREAGYDVSVIAPRDHDQPLREVLDGVSIRRYPRTKERGGLLGFALEFGTAWMCTTALTAYTYVRDGFGAIQACNPPDIFFTTAAPYKLAGRPFVFDQHDLSPELYTARYGTSGGLVSRVLLALERWTFRTADHVIAVNGPQAEVARTRGHKGVDEVTLVRNGPTLADSAPRAAQPGLKQGKDHLCIWVGVMGAVDDGVDLAVRAADHVVHELGRKDCQFAFLGDGEAYPEVTALARELDLDEYVTFTGWAERDTVLDYLATADLGLQPDPKNPRTDLATAVKTLEYMAFGVPVVAFDLDETRDTVAGAGAYATGNDPSLMGDLVDELLRDPARRARMGEHGRAAIDAGLSWDHQRRRYVQIYDRLLERAANTGGVTA